MDLIEQRARDVVERLRAKRQMLPPQGSGGIAINEFGDIRVSTINIWDDGKRLANPDGNEAADLIEQLLAERAEYVSIDRMGLRNALTPD